MTTEQHQKKKNEMARIRRKNRTLEEKESDSEKRKIYKIKTDDYYRKRYQEQKEKFRAYYRENKNKILERMKKKRDNETNKTEQKTINKKLIQYKKYIKDIFNTTKNIKRLSKNIEKYESLSGIQIPIDKKNKKMDIVYGKALYLLEHRGPILKNPDRDISKSKKYLVRWKTRIEPRKPDISFPFTYLPTKENIFIIFGLIEADSKKDSIIKVKEINSDAKIISIEKKKHDYIFNPKDVCFDKLILPSYRRVSSEIKCRAKRKKR